MKKTIKLLALSLVTLIIALACVGCAPNKDPNKAKGNLESAGYTVVKAEDAISLTVIEAVLGCNRGDLVASVTAVKANDDDSSEFIQILYFKDDGAAKACWEKAKSYLEDSAKDDTDSNVKTERSGKIIYSGTEAAIKASR